MRDCGFFGSVDREIDLQDQQNYCCNISNISQYHRYEMDFIYRYEFPLLPKLFFACFALICL